MYPLRCVQFVNMYKCTHVTYENTQYIYIHVNMKILNICIDLSMWDMRSALQRSATRWETLQRTATHYTGSRVSIDCHLDINIWVMRSTLQSTVGHCNTLQHIATHWLQHTAATHCSTLQHTATHCNTLLYPATHCNALQHTATHCNTLQHTATHCNTLQRTAMPCNTLQHTTPAPSFPWLPPAYQYVRCM